MRRRVVEPFCGFAGESVGSLGRFIPAYRGQMSAGGVDHAVAVGQGEDMQNHPRHCRVTAVDPCVSGPHAMGAATGFRTWVCLG